MSKMTINNITSEDLLDHGLLNAAFGGNSALVAFYLQEGANKDARDADGASAMHMASIRGHSDILQILLNAGADKEAKNIDGYTPLHFAAGRGQLDIVAHLVDARVDLNSKDIQGCTPLHLAIKSNHEQVVDLLSDEGAALWISGWPGKDDVNIAEDEECLEIIRDMKELCPRGEIYDIIALSMMKQEVLDRLEQNSQEQLDRKIKFQDLGISLNGLANAARDLDEPILADNTGDELVREWEKIDHNITLRKFLNIQLTVIDYMAEYSIDNISDMLETEEGSNGIIALGGEVVIAGHDCPPDEETADENSVSEDATCGAVILASTLEALGLDNIAEI